MKVILPLPVYSTMFFFKYTKKNFYLVHSGVSSGFACCCTSLKDSYFTCDALKRCSKDFVCKSSYVPFKDPSETSAPNANGAKHMRKSYIYFIYSSTWTRFVLFWHNRYRINNKHCTWNLFHVILSLNSRKTTIK